MFPVTKISLGEVVAGTQREVYFAYSQVQKIVRMTSPCDCSTPSLVSNESKILVKYIPKQLPKHLTSKGTTKLAVEKQIFVTYISQQDGKEYTTTLTFTAVVKDKP